MTKKAKIFSDALEKLFPTVGSFLNGETEFQFIVAVMLSAQMTDIGVNKATDSFFKEMKEPSDAVRMGEEKIYEFVRSVNFAPTKAKNIFRTAQILMHEYEGILPKTRTELVKLPGVGNKTAGVFLIQRGYEYAFPVDTHIKRVAKAFGFTKHDDPDKVEMDLQKKFPKETWLPLHLRIILYGRNFLPARNIPKTQKQAWEDLERNLKK